MSLRIALVGNAMDTMVLFRGPLITALRQNGHEVVAICPHGREAAAHALARLGAVHEPVAALSRAGLNPVHELRLLRELTRTLRRVQPDRVFAYFLKPVIWGGIASRRAGVPRAVGMIEGMGFAFSSPPEGLSARLRQGVARAGITGLLRVALPRLDDVIVLNPDDAALLDSARLVPRDRLTVLDGIGIDLAEYAPAPPVADPIRFTLAARLIREKGVAVFAEAARQVKRTHPGTRFRLLGGIDAAPGALKEHEVRAWVDEGLLEWPGQVDDVRPHLRETSVFVLPTLYREGLPRSIMEAMAMGRPVVTTHMPGARHSITDGVSGFLVPPGDAGALADALLRFVQDPRLIPDFGAAALDEARRRYSLERQNARQIRIIHGPAADVSRSAADGPTPGPQASAPDARP